MTKLSNRQFRYRIENHFDDLDLDVVCRKRRDAYTLYWADDQEPLARLRPTGRSDEVEVYYWDDDRWAPVTDFGMALPLEESLEFITDDPEDLFFAAEEPDDAEFSLSVNPEDAAKLRFVYGHICFSAFVGGSIGGAFSGACSGGAWGALAGIIVCVGLLVFQSGLQIIPRGIVLAMPGVFIGSAGGVLGGAVNQLISHGVWGPVCGFLVGAFFSLLLLSSERLARALGFAAGLLVAARLVEMIQLRDHLVGLALVAVAAALSACLYVQLARHFDDLARLINSAES